MSGGGDGAMSTPIKDLEVAWWAYLNGKAAYTALGLHEFRTYDGNRLPFLPNDGLFPASALPAISLELQSWGKTIVGNDRNPAVGESPLGYALQATLSGALVYSAQPPSTGARDEIENAADVLRLVLDTRAAHQGGIGSPVGAFKIDFGDVLMFSPKESKGRILFWEQRFSLVLQGNRIHYVT